MEYSLLNCDYKNDLTNRMKAKWCTRHKVDVLIRKSLHFYSAKPSNAAWSSLIILKLKMVLQMQLTPHNHEEK